MKKTSTINFFTVFAITLPLKSQAPYRIPTKYLLDHKDFIETTKKKVWRVYKKIILAR